MQSLKLISSKSQEYSLQWNGLYLHSRHDPRKEAKKNIEALAIQGPGQLVIFIGAGLAYSLQEFCMQYTNSALWYEPYEEIAALAIKHSSLAPFLEQKRLRRITHLPSDAEWEQYLQGFAHDEILFCLHRASYTAAPQYQNFHQNIQNFLSRTKVNMATLARFDRLWMRNIIANLPLLLAAQPVKRLFGTAKNQAALVCGAGPSLTMDIKRARALSHKVLIIAADTALKVLWHQGIDPDIVLLVDPQSLCRHYVEGYQGNALFVVDPAASYLALRHLPPERVFYFWSPFALAHNVFGFFKEEPGKLSFGGSVSTNAYDLAVRMGYNPILLLGQDLSFPASLAHSRGTALEELQFFRQGRIFRQEMHNYRQLSALAPLYVQGMQGEKLLTNDKLYIFYQWFCRRFQEDRKQGIRISNLASCGAQIPGLDLKSWEDYEKELPELKAASTHCAERHTFLKDIEQRRRQHQSPKALSEHLEQLAKEFHNYALDLQEGFVLAKKILLWEQKDAELSPAPQRSKAGSQEKDDMYKEMARIDHVVLRSQKLSAMASGIIQSLIFQITGKFKEGEPARPEDGGAAPSKQLLAAEQSQKLYQALWEAASHYEKSLSKASRVLSSL